MNMPSATPIDLPPRSPDAGASATTAALLPAHRVRLGEELPLFCEKCGYSLHGLAQARCERCTILHYSCPECGHHQPINTLRPAATRLLGRVRAFFLAFSVFFKLNFFGWLLFAWFGMGVEWSYNFRSVPTAPPVPVAPGVPPPPQQWAYHMVARPVDLEAVMAFVCFGLAFGMVSRMLLLRWRRGWMVGATLAALVLLAVQLGAYFRGHVDRPYVSRLVPLGPDFHLLSLGGAATIIFGALIVWPIWMALTHLFLPGKTAAALLDWKRSLSGAEFRKDPVLAGQ